ncbi:energy transducer TonB [Oceanicaulis sp. MMSF_3324]|uniref:energy transducer TonB n=1 Tax=Oceanicaulis sp. MMSF_3324 TaxID=3046702 RepID=UPI00273E3C36|nr:energy transducer TonB [Oceanicaulis sp. MMSF_3324]
MTALPASPVSAVPPSRGAVSAAARWGTAASVAVIITFALFLLMQVLIRVEVISLPEVREREPVVMNEYVPDEQLTPRTPPQPEAVTPPPYSAVTPVDPQALPSEGGAVFTPSPVTPEPEIGNGTNTVVLAPSPVSVRIPPVYPSREHQRGISGQCTIRYDILASGRTVNLQAVRCDTTGFARASLAAVERWRHQTVQGEDPNRVVNRGVETTLVFSVED